MLKAAESKYNFSPAWVKLKRDYIPGLDDTIDLVVVGASWDKDRGRELNGQRLPGSRSSRHAVIEHDLPRTRSLSQRVHHLLCRRARAERRLWQCELASARPTPCTLVG